MRKGKSLSFVEVFPNPVANDLYVRITASEQSEFDITIRNSLGSVMWRSSALIDGEHVITIPEMATLPSGVYLLEIQNEKGDSWNFKQIKH